MSALEQVLARARRTSPLPPAARRTFTLARGRALEKLRRFALRSPETYILELIQAAIANGAAYLDVRLGEHDVTVGWVGGGLPEVALGRLFDQLFSGTEAAGDLRGLALGVNAVLDFEPAAVVIASGDGTAAGTFEVTIRPGSDEVDVARSSVAMHGSFVAIRGLKRRAGLLPRGMDGDVLPELRAIEQRCLAAPVPILVDDAPLFGAARQRVPGLFGYRETVQIDEPDLVGTLGRDPLGGDPSVALLTHGVWIESKQPESLTRRRIGGVVSFERLRKTVDHGGVVEDARLEELWARLDHYARQLERRGRIEGVGAALTVTTAAGEALDVAGLRARVSELGRLVLASSRDGRASRAALVRLGRELGALVVLVPPEQRRAIELACAGAGELLAIDAARPEDLALADCGRLRPPAGPRLTAPIDASPLAWHGLLAALGAVDDARGVESSAAGEPADASQAAHVRVVVHTPARDLPSAAPGSPSARVRLVVWGHVVWEGELPAVRDGHVIDVHLPPVPPSWLGATTRDEPRALALARIVVAHAESTMAAAQEHALRDAWRSHGEVAFAPEGPLARRVLAAVTQRGLVHFASPATEGALPGLRVGLMPGGASAAAQLDLLALPVLRTATGARIGVGEAISATARTGGFVYVTSRERLEQVPAFARAQVLVGDAATVAALHELVGEAALIELTEEPWLARAGDWGVRALAPLLRPTPAGACLPLERVEATSAASSATDALAPAELDAVETALLRQLIDRACGQAPPPPDADDGRPGHGPARAAWERARRQAVRLLQWAVTAAGPAQRERITAVGLDDVLLFLDDRDRPRSMAHVRRELQRDGLLALYGHAQGREELGLITPGGREHDLHIDEFRITGLVTDACVLQRLWPLGPIKLPFELHVQEYEAEIEPPSAEPHLLASSPVHVPANGDASAWEGVVGVSPRPYEVPAILLVFADGQRFPILEDVSVRGQVIGVLRERPTPGATAGAPDLEAIALAVRAAADRVFYELLARVREPDAARARLDLGQRRRAIAALLDRAAVAIRLVRGHDGVVRPHVLDDLARAIAAVPLLPARDGGVPLTLEAIVRAACMRLTQGMHGRPLQSSLERELHPNAPAEYARFFGRWLTESQVAVVGPIDRAALDVDARDAAGGYGAVDPRERLAGAFERRLEQLRGDRARGSAAAEPAATATATGAAPAGPHAGGAARVEVSELRHVRATATTRVWIGESAGGGDVAGATALLEGHAGRITLRAEHPWVAALLRTTAALGSAPEPAGAGERGAAPPPDAAEARAFAQGFAAVLLAMVGRINADALAFTAADELATHAAVFDALAAGALDPTAAGAFR